MIITVALLVKNTVEMEIPDGLTEEEAYDYIYEYGQVDIHDGIDSGELYVEILTDLSQTEDEEEE